MRCLPSPYVQTDATGTQLEFHGPNTVPSAVCHVQASPAGLSTCGCASKSRKRRRDGPLGQTTPPRRHVATSPRRHVATPPRRHAATPPRRYCRHAATPPPPRSHVKRRANRSKLLVIWQAIQVSYIANYSLVVSTTSSNQFGQFALVSLRPAPLHPAPMKVTWLVRVWEIVVFWCTGLVRLRYARYPAPVHAGTAQSEPPRPQMGGSLFFPYIHRMLGMLGQCPAPLGSP